MNADLPPWLQPLWQRWQRLRGQDRLPHALLLSGPAGLGKRRLARRLAQGQWCEHPGPDAGPCGRCRECQWVAAGNHPNLHWLNPEEGRQQIRVDEVRGLIEALHLTRHEGRARISVLEPAEAMNLNAANALLKTLEEPAAGDLFLLISELPSRLPATIRSRCQHWPLATPPRAQALAWLAGDPAGDADAALALDLAGGAPLAARALLEGDWLAQRGHWVDALLDLAAGRGDPVALAADWGKADARPPLTCLQGLVEDLIRLQQAGDRVLRNRDLGERLRPLTGRAAPLALFELQARLQQALPELGGVLNPALLIEDLLLAWHGLWSSR